MEKKKKMTKALIGESLKYLCEIIPLREITIQDDDRMMRHAHRTTFYNYFCDKYEVVEWIFKNIL